MTTVVLAIAFYCAIALPISVLVGQVIAAGNRR
jgi:hypothetical protein